MNSGSDKSSALRDNRRRGTVADFYRQHLRADADLDLVTAYFTVFAYDRLRPELERLRRVRLLFGEAAFIAYIHSAMGTVASPGSCCC